MDPATWAMIIGAASSAIGSWMNSRDTGKMSTQQLAQNKRALAAQLGLDEAKLDAMLEQHNNDNAFKNANTTPDRVGWRQNQAISAAVMPGLRNASVSSGIPGMNHFIPQVSGGLRIPEGGFGPDTMKFFGDKAMLAGETDLDRAASVASDGRSPTPNYGAVYGAAGTQAATDAEGISAQLRYDAEQRSKRRRIAMNNALQTGVISDKLNTGVQARG